MRFLFVFSIVCFCVSISVAQGIVIDHTSVKLTEISPLWINAVQNSIQSHYAHTSHGEQLLYGLEFIGAEKNSFKYTVEFSGLPVDSESYCIYDGQRYETYVSPELYWESEEGLNMTREVLDDNPELDTSMWAWCTQCDWYGEGEVNGYLEAITQLEDEYPAVTFIYFTGNAQATGYDGYNRFMRNNQIREYCIENNKILYDFGDIDSWWYNSGSSRWEQYTYNYSGIEVPAEHPRYQLDEYGHTSVENCWNKGVAWWWMISVIAGRSI